jgi:class 3 adenylate cyclase
MAKKRGTAPPLPSGTVTFLFTDIEGSTKLWEAQREAMRGLVRHDTLMRQSIEAHGGHVVQSVGDGFHCLRHSTNALLQRSPSQQGAACRTVAGGGPHSCPHGTAQRRGRAA